jgi:aspartyl-tRNA(Asn)/glutamyl-tRNA(Gln) amidotransferase subunit B
VIQQTVSYDDQRNLTFPLRSKEEAEDYRYFPEPDLNPYLIPETMVSRIRSELPALPDELYREFTVRQKIGSREAEALIESPELALFYKELASLVDPKAAANWVLGPVKSWMNENRAGMGDFPLSPPVLGGLIRMVAGGTISYTAAQQKLLPELIRHPDTDPEVLAGELDLMIESGGDAIMKEVRKALDKYPEKILEYHRGKKGLIGLFMGEVMKSTRGKADPALANRMLLEELQKRKL